MTRPHPHGAPFHTDDGRPVTVGGGVTPDVSIAGRRRATPGSTFVTQRGYLTSYAEAYLTTHGKMIRALRGHTRNARGIQGFSSSRNGVRVPDEYWSKDQDILKVGIQVELTSLVLGLERGPENWPPSATRKRSKPPACSRAWRRF